MGQERLPNLVVAGVHKAGTTSLFTWLTWHPHIAGSSKKELHYFTPIRYGGTPAPLSEYSKYFAGAQPDHRYLVEASPSYVYGGNQLAEALDETLPNARVIVLLRNPVKRFVSFYKHLRANLSIPEDELFAAFMSKSAAYVDADRIDDDYHQRGLREGHYINYLPEWAQQYGPRLKVVFFEHMVESPFNSLSDICTWLELDPEPYRHRDFSAENQTTHYNNRLLHGLAVATNRTLEPLLRKSHGLKKGIRSLYYKLNSGKLNEQVSEEQLRELEAHYASSNKALKQWLQAQGTTHLPTWLAQA